VTPATVLPDIRILSMHLSGYGHWSLYFKGSYYDPEFGVLTTLPFKARLDYNWKIDSAKIKPYWHGYLDK
jgi:hypothetical protein